MSGKIQIIPANPSLARDSDNPVQIVVSFDRPTKVRGIRAQFLAAEKTEATYTVTTTDSKGRSRTQTRTAVEHVEIAKESFLLYGSERLGFFSRIFDSLKTWFGGGKHELVGPGDQEYSLKLQIPADAPYSFKGKKCEVFYRLTVSVDLPIKVDLSSSYSFGVDPVPIPFAQTKAVHVAFPDESGRSFWDRTFGKDVTLNLAVDRDILISGERALGMLTVESPAPLEISKIDVSLVGTENTNANGHTDSYRHVYSLGEVDSPKVISSESIREFEVLTPHIEGPFSQVGTKYEINWAVEARIHIPWAKDPTIRIPVKLLPKPISDQSNQRLNS